MSLTLPDIVELSDYEGKWKKYLAAVYEIFKTDFIRLPPMCRGLRVGLKKHPKHDDKEATFWHLISSGDTEKDREPDLRRCERIRWPRPIITNHESSDLLVWENSRKGDRRLLLLHPVERYLVVLTLRPTYMILWTAYIVDNEHQYQKLIKEHARYKRLGAPPKTSRTPVTPSTPGR